MLQRTSGTLFPHFCQALNDTGQSHIVDLFQDLQTTDTPQGEFFAVAVRLKILNYDSFSFLNSDDFCVSASVRFVGGLGVLTPPLVEDDPHTGH